MIKLISSIPGSDGIRNIIFDFGNVICDIDISLTEAKFREFGPGNPDSGSAEHSAQLFDKLVAQYEAGGVSSPDFRTLIREHYVVPPSDEAIDLAWNALLLTIPERRITLLNKVKTAYRIFLLSNSNEIHYLHYLEDFKVKSGLQHFDDLFEKAYFSFQVKLSKPDPAIFEMVLHENSLIPSETLFIDDTLKHVLAARNAGINAYHLENGMDICGLFI